MSIVLSLIITYKAKAQKIGNYVQNGSFEKVFDCDPPYVLSKAKGWSNLGSDSTKFGGPLYSIGCFSNAPNTSVGFQYPRTGNTFFRQTPYCTNTCSYYYSRDYQRNRMNGQLESQKTYCVKMYVCRQDQCPYAISDFGFYFGDNTLDTINYSNCPITYLTPQISNPINNIIIDTLNWSVISGTFVATGNEKYLVLGNFKSNAATTASLVDNSWGSGVWAEYFVDDVSCVELNLPAYAGPDKSVIPGDSVYIGRELDFAIDSGCTWYKLPDMTTPLVKASGLWVKPTTTSTYVVKQVLDCSPLKSDTVVVYMNPLGIVSSREVENDLQLFPNPANDVLEVSFGTSGSFTQKLIEQFRALSIFNNLGLLVREESIITSENNLKIRISDLPEGVYFLHFKTNANQIITERFVIFR